jgi:2-polyprenyl-3-methyl-5-hydroxy-6-metoxy-1,4-benzoquinol methylase
MFTAHRTPDALQELYTEGYFTEYPNELKYLEETDQRRYQARRRLAFVGRHGAHGRLLEIGAASGHFLEEARAAGFEPMGVEPDAELAARITERSGITVLGGFVESVELVPNSFDTIVAWHVLEHLFEPRFALERIIAALAPGGLLFLEVPNFASVISRRQREHWLHMDFEHHVAHYTPKALGTLLEGSGLRVESIESVSMREYLELKDALRPRELAAAVREVALVRSGPRSSHPTRHELLRAVARRS